MTTKSKNNRITVANNKTAAAYKKGNDAIDNRDNQYVGDEANICFLLSSVSTALLIQVANGTIDAQVLAKKELANRGQGLNGEWVGFEAAKEIHGIDF